VLQQSINGDTREETRISQGIFFAFLLFDLSDPFFNLFFVTSFLVDLCFHFRNFFVVFFFLFFFTCFVFEFFTERLGNHIGAFDCPVHDSPFPAKEGNFQLVLFKPKLLHTIIHHWTIHECNLSLIWVFILFDEPLNKLGASFQFFFVLLSSFVDTVFAKFKTLVDHVSFCTIWRLSCLIIKSDILVTLSWGFDCIDLEHAEMPLEFVEDNLLDPLHQCRAYVAQFNIGLDLFVFTVDHGKDFHG